MEKQLLQSVIEITGQRDLDSLEFSLVASLAEMMPVSSISIYKKLNEKNTDTVEEDLNLKVITTKNGKQDYLWSNQTRVVKTDELTKMCLTNATPVFRHRGDGCCSVFPIMSENIVIGAIHIDSYTDISDNTDLIENIIKIYGNYLIILDESERDKLTGLYNRRTFDKKLDRLLQTQVKKRELYQATGGTSERRHCSADAQAWLAVMDFDNFKTVNDTYGHIYGDEVLLTLSQKMKDFFRNSDLLFRFGGDEFVIVLEPIPYTEASTILENFRKSIEETTFPLIGKLTISIGFAAVDEKDYPPAILHHADRALYHAKENGRNNACNYEVLLEQGLLASHKASGAIDLF